MMQWDLLRTLIHDVEDGFGSSAHHCGRGGSEERKRAVLVAVTDVVGSFGAVFDMVLAVISASYCAVVHHGAWRCGIASRARDGAVAAEGLQAAHGAIVGRCPDGCDVVGPAMCVGILVVGVTFVGVAAWAVVVTFDVQALARADGFECFIHIGSTNCASALLVGCLLAARKSDE